MNKFDRLHDEHYFTPERKHHPDFFNKPHLTAHTPPTVDPLPTASLRLRNIEMAERIQELEQQLMRISHGYSSDRSFACKCGEKY